MLLQTNCLPPHQMMNGPPADVTPQFSQWMLRVGLLGHPLDWMVSQSLPQNAPLMLTNVGGFFVGQIRIIFHPLWDVLTKHPLYLAYVQRFDIVPQAHLL